MDESERRINLLINRLPIFLQRFVRWLRKPSSTVVRVPMGLIFIFGGFLAILPIFGLWMIPLGMLLLAQDIPLFGRWLDGLLDWVERKHPTWLHGQ